jgi:hypothetical protein
VAVHEAELVALAAMAAAGALMIDDVGASALFADAGAFFFALLVAQLAESDLAVRAVFLEDGLDAEGLLVAVYADAEAFGDESLMFDADSFQAGFALVFSHFVLHSVVFDCAFGFAFGADYVVGGVVLVAHGF